MATFIGDSSSNSLGGTTGDDLIQGNAGNDTLDGLAGADTLEGGAGNDWLVMDSVSDVVIELADAGSDTVYIEFASSAYTLPTYIEHLYSAGATALVYGNSSSNIISGNYQSDTLHGLAGNDSLLGEENGDLLYGGDGNDFLQGETDYTLYWNAGNDTLYGGQGDDFLAGFGGDDLIYGGDGDDVVFGGDLEFNNTPWGSDTLYGGAGNDLVEAGDNIPYEAAPDYLSGGSGNDTLAGHCGDNTLEGGSGSDTYVIFLYESSNVIIETGNDIDTVQSMVNWTLGSRLENLEMLYDFDTNGYGNAAANLITGSTGKNQLGGGGGADTLIGGDGDDSLKGGLGNDSLDGGEGSDRFIFDTAASAGNVDHISSFTVGSDRIRLDDAVFGALGTGYLSAATFRVGSSAQDADDRIVYDNETGTLYYDADGNGAGSAIAFAVLVDKAALTQWSVQVY